MSSQWLPFNFNFSFPILSPPPSLQRRFISFLLKRSLGHLFKPGQLDIDQIDAQIGSGFVEVKNLELDCTAINSLLDGQPLQLQSGTIAAVTVRIPWPNPFSSTVGLSLSGLRLQLYVSKVHEKHQSAGFADELAESVTSVAESFIQNELSENEEAQLRESIHVEQSPADGVPGSINPFLTQDHEPPHSSGNDPEDVSIFAGLIENLLARLDFDASDLQFSLTHDIADITLTVGRFRYFTASADNGQGSDRNGSGIGSERTVEVQGINVAMVDHTPSSCHDSPAATPRASSPDASRSARESSDSEMDEETQLTMSQSLVSLPPRPESISKRILSPSLSTILSASATSSMYQSAISVSCSSAAPPSEDDSINPQAQSPTKSVTILSISEPIVIQLLKSQNRGVKRGSAYHFDVMIPLVRVEIRVPPPKNRQPRSGTLFLDIHSLRIASSAQHVRDREQTARLNVSSGKNVGLEDWLSGTSASQTASLEMQRVVVAYADIGKSKAETFLSLGSLNGGSPDDVLDESNQPHLLPLILFRSSSPSNAVPEGGPSAVFARFPSVHGDINKTCLDGLQLWVDDLSQWLERLSGPTSGTDTRTQGSRANRLIGSRYFTQRSGSESTESEVANTVGPGSGSSEFVVKTCLNEAFVRLVVPMGENTEQKSHRFFDISASELDALVEIKPEGKDETLISLNVSDAIVKETSAAGSHIVVGPKSLGINRADSAAVKLRFRSVAIPGTVAKESRVRIALDRLMVNLWSDMAWITDLASFAKTPAGAFESVVPSERTHITASVLDCALRLTPPSRPSAIVLSLGDVSVSTDLVGEAQETALSVLVNDSAVLLNDNEAGFSPDTLYLGSETDVEYWTKQGYVLLATVQNLVLHLKQDAKMDPTITQITVDGVDFNIHLCADTLSGVSGFVADLQSLSPTGLDPATRSRHPRRPADIFGPQSSTLLRSLDEQAFRRQPVIGPLPDMVDDDVPQNLEYLDSSFGAAGGLRVLDDEDEFFPEGIDDSQVAGNGVGKHDGETIKMLYSPIEITENYFDTLPPSSLDFASEHGDTSFMIRAQKCNVQVLLYDGYDWERTRKAIQEEVKRVRRRLARIRQLLANGHTYDPNVDEVNSVLFNSVYVGLEPDAEVLERDALMAAIDDELGDGSSDIASESSWQSFRPDRRVKAEAPKATLRANKLTRANGPSIEFSIRGLAIDFDQYLPGAGLASRLLSTVTDLEILDHIRTSTWSTFLTELRLDSRGNIRETDSNMVRIELQTLQPFQGQHEQEARLKAKILPLRLHVDQDALDFLKKFFSFKENDAAPSSPPENEIFFQRVEIFPVDIKLDYKPRRVDYRALKEGRTIELMNFFHFDGSEMTLRHITLKGITGWPRMFDTLNDLWTPDVKANQLVDVISGVSPIRSAVNVGSGVADLVLLPIAQYKKDGRIIRGLQKGTTAFMKSTAMEAIKLGARLATGTQVVLEQAENVLGAQGPITAEALQSPDIGSASDRRLEDDDDPPEELYSKYAEQPTDVREGVQSAYRSLTKNMKSAGQTILAVPMEVYERSGKEGPARAVIRAVPIAVLKPMIGASEALSKALLGLHNTFDPQAQIDTETKYKHR